MPAILLEGKPLADKIRSSIGSEVSELKKRRGFGPKLVSIGMGDDKAAGIYADNQKKTAESLGIGYEYCHLDSEVSQKELESFIEGKNNDISVSGIILQLPVPGHIDAARAVEAISASKDAEGIHPYNLGKVLLDDYIIAPCTAMAVNEILSLNNIDVKGKEVVIVGHSAIVGRPLSLMMVNRLATITVCHIETAKRGMLEEHVKAAEILIVAVGKTGLIKGEWIRPGAVVIDVGINRVGKKIVGDVEFEKAYEKASYITPVPGGVGMVTTMILMRNVVEQFKKRIS